ncbi:protein kinase-like domain, Phloem protein 2-like protein [Artemisia annua]|uniref:Protein kinase-like domain, Phloem protein 2-like protein n=1 Tax=Artemisia annua TaxID=35608 RepID=A0A2U1LDI0_ARTAN|nr:protein kinase-like domain, Phloem protein 2-like protein [Artemisia annua]
MQHKSNEEDIDDDDKYWEDKLPSDYQRYIEMSDEPFSYTTKKELYLLFCHGFLARNGELWFSTYERTCGICSMQPSTHVLFNDSCYNRLETLSLPESRFKQVKKLGTFFFYAFTYRLESFMFSPDHYTYACYLVFKFEDDHVLSNDRPIFTSKYELGGNDFRIRVFANLDLTSVITIPTLKPKEDIGSSKGNDGLGMSKVYTEIRKNKSWVEKRDDGWLEARLTKPLLKKHHLENLEELKVKLWEWQPGSGALRGIIVESVEFRPVVVDNGWIIYG